MNHFSKHFNYVELSYYKSIYNNPKIKSHWSYKYLLSTLITKNIRERLIVDIWEIRDIQIPSNTERNHRSHEKYVRLSVILNWSFVRAILSFPAKSEFSLFTFFLNVCHTTTITIISKTFPTRARFFFKINRSSSTVRHF